VSLRDVFATISRQPLTYYGGLRRRLVQPRPPKHKELHQEKCNCGCRGYREELGDEDVRGEARQAKVYDGDGGQPTGHDDREILHELSNIVASRAPEHPHFVQQEMAADSNQVGNRNRNQRPYAATQKPDQAEVDGRNCGADDAKP
jgi:hypothetical protein